MRTQVFGPVADQTGLERVTATCTSASIIRSRLDLSATPPTPTVDTKDQSGKLICTNEFSLFIRGEGNFGGPKTSPALRTSVQVPQGSPDKTVTQATHTSQVRHWLVCDAARMSPRFVSTPTVFPKH